MQKAAEVHDTPVSWLPRVPAGFAVCWADHSVPFHVSASGTRCPTGLSRFPAAAQNVAEVHETATVPPSLTRGLGVGCTAQAVALAAPWARCAAAKDGTAAAPATGTVAAPAAGTAPVASARTTPAIPAPRITVIKPALRAGGRRF
jgi:hypothetical protein